MIKLENIQICYGSHRVIDGLDLEIHDKEFFTLLGASGAGKSTILNLIAGFLFPSSGRLYIHDQDSTHIPPEKRDVGIIFQNYALFPHLSVFENVAYGLRAKKVTKAERQKQVMSYLEVVDIAQYANKKPHELSGGQQQRVAIARSLVLNPRILLMDEPLSNLDTKLRFNMREEIVRLQKQFNFTTIYVTHDQEGAMSMSDRIAVLFNGKIEQIGTPQEIYENPQTEYVCQFIGEANLLPSQYCQKATSQQAYIRPERLILAKSQTELRSYDYQLSGVIQGKVYQGMKTRYIILAKNQELHAVVTSYLQHFKADDAIHIGFNNTDLISL